MLRVEHMRDSGLEILADELGVEWAHAVGIVSALVLFVSDEGDEEGRISGRPRALRRLAAAVRHKGEVSELIEALREAEYLIDDGDDGLRFVNWKRFEPPWVADKLRKRRERAEKKGEKGTGHTANGTGNETPPEPPQSRTVRDETPTRTRQSGTVRECPGQSDSSPPLPSSSPEEEEHTHTPREGDFQTGQQAAGNGQQPEPAGPIPFLNSSPLPDPIVWRDHGEAGLVGGFEGASLEGAARKRIAARFPIALDDAEWCRMVGEATVYLLDNPRTLTKVRRDAEGWFMNHWVGLERGAGGAAGSSQQAAAGGGKRSRDGPDRGPSPGQRKAKNERVLDEIEQERMERRS